MSTVSACSSSTDDSTPDTNVMSSEPEPAAGSESGENTTAGDDSGASAGNGSRGAAGDGDGAGGSEGPANSLELAGPDEGPGGDTNAQGNDDASGIPPAEEPDESEPPSPSGVCPAGPFADDPLAGAAAPVTLCQNLTFTEGAVWFADRNTLYFSDIVFGGDGNTGTIFSFSPGGQCEAFVEGAGTNGLVIGPDGSSLLGARHGDQTLTRFDLETGEPTVFLADADGTPFNSPNDLTLRSDGNLYFTDPDYGLGGAGGGPAPTGAYRLAPDGTLSRFAEGGNPNGITLSPDERRLYLSRVGGGDSIVVFELDESGAPGDPLPFASVGSDGMGIDCAGNLYITNAGQVQVFAPDGSAVGNIAAPGAANVAFGGPERRTLFITAGTQLLSVELAIPGLPY